MRIFGRNDVFLIGGLAIAVWVVSSRQLGTLLDRALEIDHSRGLQLVPALFILAAVFLIHQFRKREEMRVKASQANSRVAEMERLVLFGQALAHSLDGDSIRAVTTEHLPVLASGRDVWAMVRTGDEWISLTPIGTRSRAALERHDFEEHPVACNDQAIIITASFGITEIVPGADDAWAIIGRADAALYQAKQDGRNCVRVSEHSQAIA
jgi:predicted signal transduction protein with EAL and GGDEF domain